jgi:hypothetical protein
MQGEEKAAGSPCLQSSHISASATVPCWVHFADFFTASRPRVSRSFNYVESLEATRPMGW